ncbi:hypothetical protein [Nitrosomonas supralitoralis]|uniref:hypothetical protein n=1 Tax=Nitrosomonas supralitoralis TaxID=2116706 RepID=UPI001559A481|nr:hypothetical protein [Nitrosomonas supralitoralis]
MPKTMPKYFRLSKDYFGLLRTTIFCNGLFTELQKGLFGLLRILAEIGSGFLLAP